MKPVCLVMGAGAGIGGTVAARFAAGGYHAVLCRRSNEEGLERLVSGIRADGNEATGYLLNAVAENVVEERIAQVQAEIGPVDVVIYNLARRSATAHWPKPVRRPSKQAGAWRRWGCFGLLGR